MEILKTVKTKYNNDIRLIGTKSCESSLVIGVFHGDEPQGKFLIDNYITPPSSKSKISVLPQGEDMINSYPSNLTNLAQNLRNNLTKPEIIVWQYLKNKQLKNMKFRRQQPIGNYIVDFVCFEKKIIIELDGSQHNENKNIINDKKRDEYLKAQGFNTIRIWNNDVFENIENVITHIINELGSCPPLEGGPKSLISRRGKSPLLFIPCLNPDGMLLKTRTNANGVDLNRNFPTQNWELTENNEYFGGKTPASEIETKFLIEIIDKFKPKSILTLHTPYKVVNFDGPAKILAEKIAEIMHYPVEKSIGYPTPGSFGTYAGIERQIPTITLELDEKIEVTKLVTPINKIFDIL